jgi:hypothetical protein
VTSLAPILTVAVLVPGVFAAVCGGAGVWATSPHVYRNVPIARVMTERFIVSVSFQEICAYKEFGESNYILIAEREPTPDGTVHAP